VQGGEIALKIYHSHHPLVPSTVHCSPTCTGTTAITSSTRNTPIKEKRFLDQEKEGYFLSILAPGFARNIIVLKASSSSHFGIYCQLKKNTKRKDEH